MNFGAEESDKSEVDHEEEKTAENGVPERSSLESPIPGINVNNVQLTEEDEVRINGVEEQIDIQEVKLIDSSP